MIERPTPEQIRQARKAAGLTQSEAAAKVHATLRGWQNWESARCGVFRPMPLAAWELFLIKTKQEVICVGE